VRFAAPLCLENPAQEVEMRVTFRIKRFDPDRDRKPHFEEYHLEPDPTDRVLDALNYIKWYIDGTLTYRRSCAHGICGSDAMRINGRNRLACKILIKQIGSKVTVEPMLGFRVIKDLVVDMEAFFAQYRAVLPFLINDEPPPGTERLQSPAERLRFDDTTKCILCAACTTACPIIWGDPTWVGPAAIVNAHRFIFDSRDHGGEERLAVLNTGKGVWRCCKVFNCTEACPRDIEITRAIVECQRAILFGEPVT
jgi:succinate dehydrogenase / fumarate reductase iron-sulfur subunit